MRTAKHDEIYHVLNLTTECSHPHGSALTYGRWSVLKDAWRSVTLIFLFIKRLMYEDKLTCECRRPWACIDQNTLLGINVSWHSVISLQYSILISKIQLLHARLKMFVAIGRWASLCCCDILHYSQCSTHYCTHNFQARFVPPKLYWEACLKCVEF